MKKLIIAFALMLFSINTLADVHVDGYHRKDGTYVQPHYRSDPNGSTQDNWSTKGNVNPHTGEVGHNNLDRDR